MTFTRCLSNILFKLGLFTLIGGVYYVIEMLYRGYSHWTMFLLAGFIGVFFIDTPNNIYSFELGYLKQVGMSTLLGTLFEGLGGLIINVHFNLNVWDYSGLYGTFFYGQCNLFFMGAWFLIIGLIGIPLCDIYNYYICKIEPCPYYKINGKVVFKFKEMKGEKNV